MKAKRIFTLAMAAVLTLALLAGCGAAAPAADPTAAPATVYERQPRRQRYL